MTVAYKRKYLKTNLIWGIIWMTYGLILLFTAEEPNWLDYGWIVISLIYLILFYSQYQKHYLTLEHGLIKKNWPFGKTIQLGNIHEIKYFAGDYILKTKDKELTIKGQLVEKSDLDALLIELKKLDAVWK